MHRLLPDDQEAVPRMLKYARGAVGRPYDVHYSLDDENLYCSELVYKAYQSATGESLGKLVRLGDLDWQTYRPLIEKIEGGAVPVDRPMIPPRQLSEAPQLIEICRFGF